MNLVETKIYSIILLVMLQNGETSMPAFDKLMDFDIRRYTWHSS